MKELLLVAAVVGLATTGCAQSRLFGNRGCNEQSCQMTNSIGDTCCQEGGCDDGCCGGGDVCGCGDVCCSDPGCRSRLFARRGWCDETCQNCLGRGCGLCSQVAGRVASGFCPHSGGYPESYNFSPSPPTGQTAYPYYTTRGPRDFLQANPPSIGPY